MVERDGLPSVFPGLRSLCFHPCGVISVYMCPVQQRQVQLRLKTFGLTLCCPSA